MLHIVLHKVLSVTSSLDDLALVPALQEVPVYHDRFLDLLLIPAHGVALLGEAAARLALAEGVHEARDGYIMVHGGERNLQRVKAGLFSPPRLPAPRRRGPSASR